MIISSILYYLLIGALYTITILPGAVKGIMSDQEILRKVKKHQQNLVVLIVITFIFACLTWPYLAVLRIIDKE